MRESKRGRTFYVLTPDDGDRIDHLFGVLSMAITELLLAKKIQVPRSPERIPSGDQLMSEKNDIAKEAADDDF